MKEPRNVNSEKLTISLVTTSWHEPKEVVDSAKAYFEENGFNVRVNTRDFSTKEECQNLRADEAYFQALEAYYDSEKTKGNINSDLADQIYNGYKESMSKNGSESTLDKEQYLDSRQFKSQYRQRDEGFRGKFQGDLEAYVDSFYEMKKSDGNATDVADERLKVLSNNELRPFKNYLEDSYDRSQRLLEELHAASEGKTDIIWPIQGGGGGPEMLEFISPEQIPKNSAVVAGMSDISAVQNAMMQATDGKMKAVQTYGAALFGREHRREATKHNHEEIFDTLRKTKKSENIDSELQIKLLSRVNESADKPQIVNMSGGTLNVLLKGNNTHWQLSENQRSDTVFIEMHKQSQWIIGELSKDEVFDKLFDKKKNIVLGDVAIDKEGKHFKDFIEKAEEKGINVYEGLPFGHGFNEDPSKSHHPEKPIPLNVPCVLCPDSKSNDATLLVAPSKEKLKERLGNFQADILDERMNPKQQSQYAGRINL